MNRSLAGLALGLSIFAFAQRARSHGTPDNPVMIAAVSRDGSLLVGGIGSGSLLPNGKLDVSPLAWLTPAGDWKPIRCDESHPVACREFDKDYLSRPHNYGVVSNDGWGANVRVSRMTLDNECFGYYGTGTYSGPTIHYAAVAASATGFFSPRKPAVLLTDSDADTVRRAFAGAAGSKLDSTRHLRVYSFQIGGEQFFAIQRAFQDYVSTPGYDPQKDGELGFIFAIGTMKQGQFHILSWQNKVDNDENEQILGIIHLTNGKDFLVNTVSDPESQYFRIYGIRRGQLSLVFEGGGGGC
jgi:hypothetical protein